MNQLSIDVSIRIQTIDYPIIQIWKENKVDLFRWEQFIIYVNCVRFWRHNAWAEKTQA